ncbi:AAA family ATPase [Methylorubrum zatmanii]|nr:ATP-binding protein [Methylorubrum zatmanii]ARO55862.1 AAA family ATPase [Methylorubrum zatmanii]
MSLPDINFNEIRLHGNQADAFEELCCQLASDEASPDRVQFDRKGRGGDAGIECFEKLADGSEVGWQVKFYWDIDSMLRSLGKSLDTALLKHPKMRKFIACFPFDLADARKDGTTTALEKWDAWRAERIAQASKTGRTIEVERWDAHALRQRLTGSNPRAAGRIAFWFDRQLFTYDWFEGKFARAKAALGERYDPEGHIDLPVGRALRAVTGDPAYYAELEQLGDAVRRAADEAFPTIGTPAADACAAAATALHAAAQSRIVPATALCDAVHAAADAAFALHDELDAANGDRPPCTAMVVVSELAARLRGILAELRWPHWALLNRRSLLVYGAAGSGKSHLLADACTYQLAARRPALMILGGTLADDEPWSQILKGLDLPRHLEVGQFLGALNAAGEAAGVRALIAVDALNEKNGQAIWPERLAGLLHDIKQFPWIAVVLSCRTTYLELVIPDTLDAAKLPRIEHRGFSVAEVRAYLRQRGMTLPETPLQAAEFRTPLFLRLYCDALEFEGETLLARGLGGVTDIFRAYTDAVVRRVQRQLKVPPGRNPAAQALTGLAREMADTGRANIRLDRAEAIVRTVHPGRSTDEDLLFQLENEGMLAVDPTVNTSGEAVQAVRFTFERMGDHAVAANLLARSGGDATGLCAVGTPLHAALDADDSWIVPGLFEALAVQLPEAFGVELHDLPGLPAVLSPDRAFVQSLQARRLEAVTARTWQLVDAVGGDSLRYDTLIALATEPGHPNNVRHLDAELRALPMGGRDARWSIHLARSPDVAFHLIDWVRVANPTGIAPERAELAAMQLVWFLTATHRALRDKATKALVVLFADRAALAMQAWQAFAELDDLYVVERLAAALFGAAMQGRWSMEELRAVAELLHAGLFAGGRPPANELLRDHTSGLIGYAAARGALSAGFDMASTRPPFSSAWPIEKISEEQMAAFNVAYGEDGKRFHDAIVGSLKDGDFARYVLDPMARRFSPAPRGTEPMPTAEDLRSQWLAEFTADASKAELAAYTKLQAAIAAIKGERNGPVHADRRADLRAAKRDFCDAIGAERFEDWRARAESWRDEGLYQGFPARGPAEFNLAWARRWVTWRAHDLGWSETLHHEFDRRIGTGRNSHEIERIGKKYQWLATYELAARMEDNLAVLPREEEVGPSRLRNIDPSMLRERTSDDGWRQPRDVSFWAPYRPTIEAATPSEALVWLNSGAAMLDGPENIEVVDQSGRHWLVLTGFEIWAEDRNQVRSESWRRIGCTIVRAADLGQLLARLKGIHMTGHHDMPVGSAGGYHMHLGEHPWAWSDRSNHGWIEWHPNGGDWQAPALAVRPPTVEYTAESNGYDYSITQNITLNLPADWLIDALDLLLSDGQSITYRNARGEVMFMDPSVHDVGRTAALVDRTAFLEMLEREELVAIWAVAGEKSVFGELHSDGFGGRRDFTRLFHSNAGALQALPRFETFEKASCRQRAILLGEDAEGLADDEEDIDVEM